MRRVCLIVVLLSLSSVGVVAQDLENVQIHGFATQGFLFSSQNNYLSMKSSSGSLRWTEGAISVNDAVTDKLRVGIQLHMYQIGEFGGPNVLVDWVSGDYQVNDGVGFRVGKIKTPIGLFNDSQDVDSLFLWVLLPQAMYPVDNRGYELAELGGELYGRLPLTERWGRLQFALHAGSSTLDANGGYVEQLAQIGMTFADPPSGNVYGGDLRWALPKIGLSIGASALSDTLDGTGPQGSVHMPSSLTQAYSAQWDFRRLHLAGEYWRTPFYLVFNTPFGTLTELTDQHSWYPMVRYELTKKLQVGSYYSYYVNKAADTSQSENYSKDWVVSGRYDFNSYFYAKVEGHFLHGTGLGYYTSSNPDGLKPNTNMLSTRIGFTF
jgi:hypothetical protein